MKRYKSKNIWKSNIYHWNYRHKIFLDEHRISDQELCRLADIDYETERKELQEYCKCKGISLDIVWNS